MMPRVFIPQLVERWDHVTRGFVPVYDFSSAATFGALSPILEKGDDPMFIASLTQKIQDALKDFADSDYFVAVGDPSVIAVCAGIILRKHDRFCMLKWDKKMSCYIPVEVRL